MADCNPIPKKQRIDKGPRRNLVPTMAPAAQPTPKAVYNRPTTTTTTVRPSRHITNWGDGQQNWEEMDHLTKIRKLTPRLKMSGVPDQVDIGFFEQLPPSVKIPPSEKRAKKMQHAVEFATQKVKEWFQDAEKHDRQTAKAEAEEDEDGDELSSDESYDSHAGKFFKKEHIWRKAGVQLMEKDVVKFVQNLPKHLIFTASFDATGSDPQYDELCHCPCSLKRSAQWLEVAQVASIAADIEKYCNQSCSKGGSKSKGLYRHFALLAHLIQFSSDPVHYGILQYVEELYSNHYGSLSHEALYKNVDNTKYQQACAAKVRQFEHKIAVLHEETLQWRAHRCKLAQHDNDEQREEIKKNRDSYDKLKLTGKEKILLVPEKTMGKVKSHYKQFLKGKTSHLWMQNIQSEISSEDIPQPVHLSTLFEKWSCAETDKSCLFIPGDDNREKVKLLPLLKEAEWNFATLGNEENKGIDAGCGLTRSFFDEVWKQLGTLFIDVNESQVKLFEEVQSFAVPIPDDKLLHDVARAFKVEISELDDCGGAIDAIEKARRVYTAVGRLMIHSLATNHVLPWNLFPRLYRAYLFCERSPTDQDYSSIDLCADLRELDFRHFEKNDDFKKMIEDQMIDERFIALHSILQGLTLHDQIDLRQFFCGRDVRFVDGILFSAPSVSAEMIIKNLKGINRGTGDTSQAGLTPIQQKFMEETLPEYLRSKDECFLKRFLQHVTGLSYMNRNRPEITIGFEPIGNSDPKAWPEAHTCEQELDFPLDAYDANIDDLAFALGKAIEYSSSEINMS